MTPQITEIPPSGFCFAPGPRSTAKQRDKRNSLQTVGRLDCHRQRAAELLEDPAMYRVRYGWKRWRNRWPWKWLFPPTVDERYCPKCRLPYQDGPQPKERKQFISGNVAGLVYPAGNWGQRKYAVKFGRWKASSRQFYLSEYFSADDFDDLNRVAAQAHAYIGASSRQRARRR